MAVVYGLDHVTLALPEGGEEAARAFYVNVLGMDEQNRPERLNRQGVLWLVSGALCLHLTIEPDFHPSAKAHPAFLVDDLAEMRQTCESAGVLLSESEAIEGYARAFLFDPFGNRLELMERLAGTVLEGARD